MRKWSLASSFSMRSLTLGDGGLLDHDVLDADAAFFGVDETPPHVVH